MLVLTRKINEKICINDDITITVLKNTAGAVSLGIQAPAHISVHREEIYKRIQAKKENS